MSDWSAALLLREPLRPNIDHIAQQPGARKLCRALALADGFSFQLAVCNTARAAAALLLWLDGAVAAERETPVAIERISPYPVDWRAAGPDRIDADELGELVFADLFDRGELGGRLVFIDAARATSEDADAWRWLMLRLNERRNVIAQDLAVPLTLILPPQLEAELARLAPDLWSIRSVAVQVRDLDEAGPTGLLHVFEYAQRGPDDLDSLTAAVEQARANVEGGGSEASLRALRVLLLRLAGAKQRAGDIDETERLIDEATALAEQVDDQGALAACRLARSELLVLRGDLDAAQRSIESALTTLQQLGDEWAVADAWSRLGDVLVRRGQLDEALRIHRDQELPVYERLGDTYSRAVAMGRIAGILQSRGQLDEALHIYRDEQLPVFERLGEARSHALAMSNIAGVLQARGQLDEALRIYREEALPVYERLGDVRSRAVAMGGIADILRARGQLDEALRIYRDEQLPVFERLGDIHGRAVATSRIADILVAQARFDEAIRIYREDVLPMYERLDSVRHLTVDRTHLALALAQRGPTAADMAEITTLLTEALHDARRLSIPETARIESIIRQLGGDPNAPPYA